MKSLIRQLIVRIADSFGAARTLGIELWLFSFVSFAPLWWGHGITDTLLFFVVALMPSIVFASLAGAYAATKPNTGGGKWLIISVFGYTLSFIQLFLCTVNVLSWILWDFSISNRMLIILMQTNPNEATGFLNSLSDCALLLSKKPLFWLFIAAAISLPLLARLINTKYLRQCIVVALTLSILGHGYYFATCTIKECGRKCVSVITQLGVCAMQTYKTTNMLKTNLALFEANSSAIPEITKESGADNIIVIMGESSSAFHWQLYGYTLPTTPHLNQMRDSLLVFNDVVPPQSYTNGVFSHLLTQKDHDKHQNEWYTYIDLIRLARAAGYTTYWLSTQEKVGAFVGCIPVCASHADSVEYLGAMSWEDNEIVYDNILVPALHKVLNDSATQRLVVLHTMGSHQKYDDRVPQNFKPFDVNRNSYAQMRPNLSNRQLQRVADYDNSIAYTDSVLCLLLNECSTYGNGSTAVIYLSDHSEDIYEIDDYCNHAQRGKYVKIPMLFWANRQWCSKNSGTLDILEQRQHQPLESEDIFHVIQHLMGAKSSVYDSCHDFSSDTYIPSVPRVFMSKPYVED